MRLLRILRAAFAATSSREGGAGQAGAPPSLRQRRRAFFIWGGLWKTGGADGAEWMPYLSSSLQSPVSSFALACLDELTVPIRKRY